MDNNRWERREKKKFNKRKHKVIGKSVLLLQKIIGIKANNTNKSQENQGDTA